MRPQKTLLVLTGLLGVALSAPTEGAASACDPSSGHILGYSMKSLEGRDVHLQSYAGGPLLVTNTAAF